MEKFRPFLWRNYRLMMIREAPLRLGMDRIGEDKYIKLRGGKLKISMADVDHGFQEEGRPLNDSIDRDRVRVIIKGLCQGPLA
jgi:hypothetical protein